MARAVLVLAIVTQFAPFVRERRGRSTRENLSTGLLDSEAGPFKSSKMLIA
jgi:hypothetical protein